MKNKSIIKFSLLSTFLAVGTFVSIQNAFSNERLSESDKQTAIQNNMCRGRLDIQKKNKSTVIPWIGRAAFAMITGPNESQRKYLHIKIFETRPSSIEAACKGMDDNKIVDVTFEIEEVLKNTSTEVSYYNYGDSSDENKKQSGKIYRISDSHLEEFDSNTDNDRTYDNSINNGVVRTRFTYRFTDTSDNHEPKSENSILLTEGSIHISNRFFAEGINGGVIPLNKITTGPSDTFAVRNHLNLTFSRTAGEDTSISGVGMDTISIEGRIGVILCPSEVKSENK